MKLQTKRVFSIAAALSLALVMLVSFAGCAGSTANNKPHSQQAIDLRENEQGERLTKYTPAPDHKNEGSTSISIGEAKKRYIVTVNDCYRTGWFAFVADDDSTYTVTVGGAETEWKIYVLDEKYTGELSAISEEYEPALSGPGSMDVHKDQYVYIYCASNALTGAEPVEGKLEFSGSGLPIK